MGGLLGDGSWFAGTLTRHPQFRLSIRLAQWVARRPEPDTSQQRQMAAGHIFSNVISLENSFDSMIFRPPDFYLVFILLSIVRCYMS